MTPIVVGLVGQLIGIWSLAADPDSGFRKERLITTTAHVLQCVFSAGNDRNLSQSADTSWSIQGTVVPYDAPEWQYTLRRTSGTNNVEAELRWIQDAKLLGRPGVATANTCVELRSIARVGERRVTRRECSALNKLVSRLERLRLPSVPDPAMRLHVSDYSITAATLEGDEFHWRLAGAPGVGGSSHPLVAWSEDLRRSIEACPRAKE